MVRLIWGGRDVLLPGGKQVPLGGLRSYAAIAAIITYMGDVVIDDLLVVDGIDDSRVADIRDGPVIVEGIAGPISSRRTPRPYSQTRNRFRRRSRRSAPNSRRSRHRPRRSSPNSRASKASLRAAAEPTPPAPSNTPRFLRPTPNSRGSRIYPGPGMGGWS